MIFRWMKSRRRAKILTTSFPNAWQELIGRTVPQVEMLTPAQQEKHQRLTQVFMMEKNWEGINGLELTEEMRVVIAAMACLLVVGLPEDEHFDHVLSILVSPASYVARNSQVVGTGTIIESHQARIGEAHYRGPVVVAWSDVRETARNETFGRNVVIHEFAHQLDMLNGRVADGVPVFESEQQVRCWEEIMQQGYEQLLFACQHGHRTLIDCYGATNRAEFFAVISELFFEGPTPLRYHHPEIYDQLCRFYGLDPANWGT